MFQITARCAAGHVQVMRFAADFTETYVRVQAGLLDGTSSPYALPPDERSIIGKCGQCGAQIACTVSPYDPSTPPADGDISVTEAPGGIRMEQH